MTKFYVYLGTGTARRQLLPSLSELGRGPFSSAPTQIPFFQVTEPLGIIAKKSETMQSLFLSDVFMDVAVVGS